MFPPRQFVGLDIGHANVRAVVLRRDQSHWKITGHAIAHRRDAEGQVRNLAITLGELISQLDLKGQVCVGLSDISALVRYVATIPLPSDRLTRLLRLELQQNLEGAELAADTFPVPLAGDEIVHCCVLAQSTQIYEALKELGKAGISVDTIHFAPIAIYHTTLPVPPVNDDQIALLVDIGAVTTNVAMFGERRMLACRQLTTGGDAFARALAAPAVAAVATQPLTMPNTVPDAKKGAAAAKDFAGDKPLSDLAFAPDSEPALPQLDFDDTPGRARPAVAADPLLSAAPPVSTSASVSAPASIPDTPMAKSISKPPLTSAPADHLSIQDDSPFELSDDVSAHPAVHGQTTLPEAPPLDVQQASGAFELDLGQAQEIVPLKGVAGVATPAQPSTAPAQLTPEQMRVAETLYSQLISSLAWFKIQIHARDITVAKVFLAGGGANVPGLVSYLERRFGVPVSLHDPCVGIEGEAPAQAHAWTTALGLAMTSAKGAIPIDLTPDELLRKKVWRERVIWPYIAAACLLLCGVLTTMTLIKEQSAYTQSQAEYTQFESEYQAQYAKIKAAEDEELGLGEDLRTIKSRLNAGSDLLHVIRALKDRVTESPELWVTNLNTHDVSQDEAAVNPPANTHSLAKATASTITGSAQPDNISRGAVDLKGQVKFGSAKANAARNVFFDAYMKWLEVWTPVKDAPRLFADATVLEYVNKEDHDKNNLPGQSIQPGRPNLLRPKPGEQAPPKSRDKKGPVDENDLGHFYFTIRLPFVPTPLLRVPATKDATQVPSHAP